MPTYEIQTPDGRTFEVDGPRPPTHADIQKMQVRGVFGASGKSEPATPSGPTFSTQPVTGREFRDRMAANNSRIADLAAEHPYITAGATLAAAGAPALLRSATTSGAPLAARALSVVKEAASQATPVAKYEAVRMGLEAVGVPSSVAVPFAMVVSGYKRPAKAEPVAPKVEATPASAAPASPVASPPVAAAPPAPEAPRQSAPTPPGARSPMSPQRIQNELGLAARRAKLAPTAEEYAQATDAVAQGRTPQEAIAELAAKKPTPSAPAAETPAPKKARASKAPIPTDKDELLEYAKLIRAGKTHKQAMTAIAQQRALAKQFGTPSVAEVEARVDARNRTGRWPKADQ